MYQLMAGVTVLGAVAAVIAAGAPALIGFLLGAAFSAANFWLWHRLVARVGEVSAPGEQPHKISTMFFGLRYFLFIAAGYVILRFFEASLFAALAGCFVAVAAVILEILVELIYGTS
jgi:hypothetical protein